MFEERKYQVNAEKSVFNYLFRHPKSHPLVALPAGSGKTAVMHRIALRLFKENPSANILCISSFGEIIKQNYKVMATIMDCGLYFNEMKSRTIKQLTVASIHSIHNHSELFKHFDYIFVDECHTVPMSPKSMYRKFFDAIGDHTRIGFTATPYKLGFGELVGDDHVFDKIVINLTEGSNFINLIDDGYLSSMVIKETLETMDDDGVKKIGREFSLSDLSDKFDNDILTDTILLDLVKQGSDRKKWLLFAIDTKHADNICDKLNVLKISAMVVHSKMDLGKDFVIDAFRNGDIQCVVSVGMMTTGVDIPAIDLIGLLRMTASPNLHVQMICRGSRIHKGKKNCLVLDYAGNTARIGPINMIKVRRKRKGKKDAVPITKTCPKCSSILHPSTKVCPDCGYKFEFKKNLTKSSSKLELFYEENKWCKVSHVFYSLYEKNGKQPSIKVEYICGISSIKEWIFPDHTGFSKTKTDIFLKNRGIKHTSMKDTISALEESAPPKRIKINDNSTYPIIEDYEFS